MEYKFSSPHICWIFNYTLKACGPLRKADEQLTLLCFSGAPIKVIFSFSISATSGVVRQVNNYNIPRAWQIILFENPCCNSLIVDFIRKQQINIFALYIPVARIITIIIMVFNIAFSLQERGKQHGIISKKYCRY